ncbi:TonB-dependent receptor [Algimonas porphyrae]|uniref:TonB-dependent receptor n=1 Tax=Algimonas porphyrae TaxID=1128113 RepID=A0ABQ5V178_9PROT|nr:TonB-dependent receptor [Algimonas porphyrae]GLQ21300.1 TonB-dependent receptor [Algimonas porphyrae]
MTSSFSSRLLGASVLALSFALTAQAQDRSDEDVIIVTGQKIDRDLQDVNASVAVFTGDVLDQNNVLSVADALELVAGVNTTQEGRGYSIRGANVTFTQTVDAGLVNNAPLSSIYVDGVILPPFQTQGGPTRAWDVEQIEVFRGPQSTVLGRNTLSGAIVVKTKDPSQETEGAARVEFAEYGRRQYAAALGGGLTDTLSARLSVEYFEEDGDITNPFLNIDNQDFVEALSLRGKLLYEAPNAPFTAKLTLNYVESEEGFGGVYDADNRFGVPDPDPFLREGWNNTPVFDDRETKQAILELNYELNDQWSVTSLTGYSDAELFGQKDGDNGPILFEDAFRDRREKTWSQELRFNLESDRLTGVTGAFLFTSDFELENFGELGDIFLTRDGNPGLGIPSAEAAIYSNPALGLPSAVVPLLNSATPEAIEIQFGDMNTYVNDNYALFADFDYRVADQWTLSLGGRLDYQAYDYERFGAFGRLKASDVQSYLTDLEGALSSIPGFPAAAVPQVLGAVEQNYIGAISSALLPRLGSTADQSADGNDTVFLPKAGLTYDFNPNASLAFTVQRGYRTGGISFQASTGIMFPYDPEFTWNYETALRTSWLDNRLIVNANAYYIDWKDQQVGFQEDLSDPFSGKTVNAGESTVLGAEVEIIARPTDNLNLAASIGYNDTEFDEFNTGNNDFSGNPFALAPKWTGSIRGSYDFDNGLFVSGNGIFVDDRFQFERATNRLDSYVVVNARVGYRTDQFTIAGFVNNLFDEEYLTQNRSTIFSTVGNPQSFGASLSVNW